MKILVLNCGSSSIKYKLFDMDSQSVIAQGGIEKIGLPDSFLKLTLPNGEKKILEKNIPEHTVGVEFILDTLVSAEYGAIQSVDEINAVGHRMVHGGEKFSESVLLTPEVLEAFTACNDLAPLHNPANLKGVRAIEAILPNVPQIGVFDQLSIRPCPTMHTCMQYLMNCIRSMVCVAMASMELLIATFPSVCVNSWVSRPKERKSLLATLETVVLSRLSRMENAWIPVWDLLRWKA